MAEDTPTFFGVPQALSKEDLLGADVVIIGAPYVAGWGDQYFGVDKKEWLHSCKRVRQQSIRYRSGYIQDFDLDVFETMKVVDYGDADIPPEASYAGTVSNILEAQAAVERKVKDALEAGAVPIVIGQNSPCGSYAIAKPLSESVDGPVGMVSLDTHWDANTADRFSMDPRIAGSGNWKDSVYKNLANFHPRHLVEIGERGMLEHPDIVRRYLRDGAEFISGWRLRTELGIEGTVKLLPKAFDGTDAVYAHFDLDVMGGAGPAPGDILGELAEPIGMTDYEVIRIAHESGKLGCNALSFICIPPGSPVMYRVVVYCIMYFIAGLAMRKS
ncbi:arginase family protein [Billgrantia endophytica]|uniref:arginase family protein n=1 Tax=Billgrantia endophytica TaxID=2033802 RepID=UPI00197A8457|nr:arginase family protein [Halomonas endophytica]